MTVSTAPKTIHDFGGFPRELFEVQYPAPGYPELAARVQKLLAPLPVRRDERWGLDHGTWSVLCHVYPQADVPVLQLSIDENQPASFHYEIGQRIAPLREESILIIGSGNLVHNLHAYAWGQHTAEPYEWAVSFERRVRELLLSAKRNPSSDTKTSSAKRPCLRCRHPTTTSHCYTSSHRTQSEPVSFPVEGVDGGSIFDAGCEAWVKFAAPCPTNPSFAGRFSKKNRWVSQSQSEDPNPASGIDAARIPAKHLAQSCSRDCPAGAKPNLFQCRVSAEIVDVPVRTFSVAHVVSQSGTYASQPKCTANVDVEPRLEAEAAQPPDPDYSIPHRRQQEGARPAGERDSKSAGDHRPSLTLASFT